MNFKFWTSKSTAPDVQHPDEPVKSAILQASMKNSGLSTVPEDPNDSGKSYEEIRNQNINDFIIEVFNNKNELCDLVGFVEYYYYEFIKKRSSDVKDYLYEFTCIINDLKKYPIYDWDCQEDVNTGDLKYSNPNVKYKLSIINFGSSKIRCDVEDLDGFILEIPASQNKAMTNLGVLIWFYNEKKKAETKAKCEKERIKNIFTDDYLSDIVP